MGEAKRRMSVVTDLATRRAEATTQAKKVIDGGGHWFLAYVDPKGEVKWSANDASLGFVMPAVDAFAKIIAGQMSATPQPADPTV